MKLPLRSIGWLLALGALAAGRYRTQRHAAVADAAAPPAAASKGQEPVSPARLDLTEPRGPHPRLLLTAERLERARRHRSQRSAAWTAVVSVCDQARTAPQGAGYEGWDWGNLVADCALVWHVTKDDRYAQTALLYLRALIDDAETPGDGKGGDTRARHDHGYAIRAFGFYTALGFDWLHDAPGMTPDLRARIVRRLDAWLDWYRKEGYKKDAPLSNYFIGYFGALSFAAFATSGENQENLIERTERLFAETVAPAFAKLSGGDWPEGWQYGDGVAVALAFFLDAERTAKGKDRRSEVPWVAEVVRHHAHALLPDGITAYDNGDWSSRPARMPARALEVLAMVLPDQEAESRQARFLARQLQPERDEYAWLGPLWDERGAPAEDPAKGPASFLAKGTGLALLRSDWSKQAIFVSLQCGPTFADADHQHADQGHFELVRGKDALLVDPGDYTAFATINHNSLLVDDRGEHLDYSPNQGGWGRDSAMTRFVDQESYVYAAGDFADAYRPSKLEYGVKRSVLTATREILFLRPATLLIRDRVTTAKPDYRVTWLAHALARPTIADGRITVRRGASRADVETLLPEGAVTVIREEPSNTDDHPFTTNRTYVPSYRVEVRAEAGSRAEHRFLHVVRAGEIAGEPAERAMLARVEGGEGAVLSGGAGPTLGIFADGAASIVRYTSPHTATHVVVGLLPHRTYAVQAEHVQDGCRVSLAPGKGKAADAGGTLLMRIDDCAPK
jgi:hypothetical protein